MSRKQKLKIIIDLLLTVFVLLLMPYGMVGEAAHEWIGVGMLLLLENSQSDTLWIYFVCNK